MDPDTRVLKKKTSGFPPAHPPIAAAPPPSQCQKEGPRGPADNDRDHDAYMHLVIRRGRGWGLDGWHNEEAEGTRVLMFRRSVDLPPTTQKWALQKISYIHMQQKMAWQIA